MKPCLIFTLSWFALGGHAAEHASAPGLGKSIELTSIHNAYALPGGLYSGSSPEDDGAFATLAALGIKVIVSVDGAKPKVDLAEKYGMRYVHLPIGYDSVPPERVAELVKAASEAPGPVFVHCHHGRHRGPAAISVICQAKLGWTPEEAVGWLKQAGTAEDYAGLYRSVREFQIPDEAAMARVGALPSVAETTPVVDAMVAIDEAMEQLKAAQKREWREVPGYRDVTPHGVAVLLWEAVRELGRHPDSADRPEEYQKLMQECETAAAGLRDLLKDANATNTLRSEAMQRLGKSCSACHKHYRN
jgi:protein tyrosine phosphatase (PTP) superfamily phosphohydrolase (DUF442 family)